MTKKCFTTLLVHTKILLALLLLGGCASWRGFKTEYTSRFINMNAETIFVEYARESRTETHPNGLVCTYHGKVRVHLANGTKIVLYQTIATSGNRYLSANKRYEFIEKAPLCALLDGHHVLFEGVYRP